MALSLIQAKNEIEATRPTFEQMNLNNVSFSKELEFAMQAFQNNSYLLTLDPGTVRNCLVNVALTGTTLNPVMREAYLVPRKGKCCLDMSYIGLIKVITDTGSVKSIRAGVVYQNETFDVELGSNGFVKHKPCLTGDKGARIGAYSLAVLHDGSNHVEFMYEAELMGIMKRSEGVKAGKSSPWLTDPDEMCRKTVVKRHWKYLPKSERAIMAAQAIAIDHENNGIDFKAEREQQVSSFQPAGAVRQPEEPQEALATQEDLDRINELFDDPGMPPTVFNNIAKDKMKTAVNNVYAKGTLVKSKAEEYIKGLEFHLSDAKKQAEAAAAAPAQPEKQPEF